MIDHCNHYAFINLVLFTVHFYHFLFSRYLTLTKCHFLSDILVPFPDSNNLYSHEDVIISKYDLKKMLQKLTHWKAPGKDGLQGYWIKASWSSLHDQFLNFLNLCFQSGQIPDWMVLQGKNVLPEKDLNKDHHIPSKYQPITCLPNIWKY